MSTAIEFNHVSKQYRLGLVSTKTLSHDLNRWWQTAVLKKEDPYLKIGSVNDRATAADSEYVWALKDIDFKVEQGDVVGIIGKNGAGKSTLLKLLSRVTGPTTGSIRASGRIGSLLEVGTGFHSEMTGRENIYMNGAILGMTKNDITRKLDEIIDFSGCERYIDTPVKRYSSGMMVRLGFAVAAFLEPEILVVDEVLAVGDAEFQKKAIGKMQDVSKGEGRTVLFVSHNMASVRRLCDRGIVLDKGSIVYDGGVNEAIRFYSQEKQQDGLIIDAMVIKKDNLHVKEVLINGSPKNSINVSPTNNTLELTIKGFLDTPQKASLEVRLCDAMGTPLFFYSPQHASSPLLPKGEFELSYMVCLPKGLTKGLFYGDFYITDSCVEGLVDFHHAFVLESEGIATRSGFIMEYNAIGALFLD